MSVHSTHAGITHSPGQLTIDYAVVDPVHAQLALDIFTSRTCLATRLKEGTEQVSFCTRGKGHSTGHGWELADIRQQRAEL